MASGRFISYLRVSTDKQGRSGLGLEAQREMVERYMNSGDGTLVHEYIETETAKKTHIEKARPVLKAALDHAKAIGGTLVFAKLDRLTRDVDLLRSLVNSDAELVFCDMPSIPLGAMGKFLLTQMASVAELEAGLVSERTKAALAAAKARGTKLGNPNGARCMQGKQTGNREAVEVVRRQADERARRLRSVIENIRSTGTTTESGIASALNERGIITARGGKWHATSVHRLLTRLI